MKNILYIALSLFFFGCIKQENVPANLISKDKMAEVLIEIHLAEAGIEQKQLSLDSSKVMYYATHKEIMKKHAVSEEQFKTSYRYYLENIKEMDDVYTIVLDKLSIKEAQNRAE